MMDTILFDFFGTLVQYSHERTAVELSQSHRFIRENVIDLEYDSFLEVFDKSFRHLEQLSIKSQLEFSMMDVVSEFISRANGQALSEDARIAFIDLYMSEWSSEIRPFPNLNDLLDKLALEYKLGIVSNTHHIGFVPALLKRFKMVDYFEKVITSIDHGRPKPHESIYTSALSALEAEPQSSLFIGDSYEHDYLGPRRFGIRSILISKSPPDNVPLSHVVSNIDELKDLVLRFNEIGSE